MGGPPVDLGALAPLLRALERDAAVLTGQTQALAWDAAEAPPTSAGDPETVREVLDDLVGNALEHADAVAVTVRAEGEQVRFDVRDEGPGLPEATQAHLSDRWTRTQDARERAVAGLGLGLSIVERLVVAHGGTLGVSSRLGEGSTFWVTFPRTLSRTVAP